MLSVRGSIKKCVCVCVAAVPSGNRSRRVQAVILEMPEVGLMFRRHFDAVTVYLDIL